MGKNISIYLSATHMRLSRNVLAQKKKKPDMEFKYQTRLKNRASTLDITSYLWLWWAQQPFFFFFFPSTPVKITLVT